MVKQILPKAGEAILALFNKLGGNMNNVLGSRSNITFLGKGKNPEGFIDADINTEAIGFLGKNKILEELESSIGYLTAGKLNDVQANKLLENMQKVDEVFSPKQVANITDLATGTRNLDQEGLGALRETEKIKRFEAGQKTGNPAMKEVMQEDIRSLRAGNRQMTDEEIRDFADEFGIDPTEEYYNFDGTLASAQKILKDSQDETAYMYQQYKAGKLDPEPGEANRQRFLQKKFDEMEATGDRRLMTRDEIEELSAFDDLPPSGSGGIEDIPLEQGFAGFERTIRSLAKQDPELAAQYRTVMSNKGDVPVKRASAREFLVEALKKENPNDTTFADIVSEVDVKYITEGGGGIAGDPIALVNKYFGPRIAEALPSGASSEEIAIFTQRVLNNVVDANGLRPGDPRFDRLTATFIDNTQNFAKGGLAKILEV